MSFERKLFKVQLIRPLSSLEKVCMTQLFAFALRMKCYYSFSYTLCCCCFRTILVAAQNGEKNEQK